MKSNRFSTGLSPLDLCIAIAAFVVVFLTLLFVAYYSKLPDNRADDCHKAGGVMVRAENGYECVRVIPMSLSI